jgi:vancomycin permeability regulator SanA
MLCHPPSPVLFHPARRRGAATLAGMTVPEVYDERPSWLAEPDRTRGLAGWARRALGSRLVKGVVLTAVLVVFAAVAPSVWLRAGAAAHVYSVDQAPTAPVAVVFGAQLWPGGSRPKPFLAGRLDVAADLIRTGKTRAILVSGDAHGSSGDETAAMAAYLVAAGVDRARIVTDPYGLDTYDTCRRAREVYGVTRAVLISQALHLPRAVTLCRHFGIDADGVQARCDGCNDRTLAANRAREVPAAVKAAVEVLRDRPPAVSSPPDPVLTDALR